MNKQIKKLRLYSDNHYRDIESIQSVDKHSLAPHIGGDLGGGVGGLPGGPAFNPQQGLWHISEPIRVPRALDPRKLTPLPNPNPYVIFYPREEPLPSAVGGGSFFDLQ